MWGKVMAMPQLSPRRWPPQSRPGRTLPEQLAVLTVTGLLLALAVAPGWPLLDRIAVATSAQEIVDLLGTARDIALARQSLTAVYFDVPGRRVLVQQGGDTLARTVLSPGVALQTTRDSLAYASTGLGYGSANLRLIVSKGRAADTITISRLGRVSH